MEQNKYKLIDVFSGCGGLSTGFKKAGFEVLAGIDNCDKALFTFEKNHRNSKSFNLDISKITKNDFKDITGQIGDVDIVVGGPPCQGYSIAGKRIVEDTRNNLYKGFSEFLKYFTPKAFVMENVPNLHAMGNGKIKERIIKEFQDIGYTVYSSILLASDYGVPQNRKRLFFIGYRDKCHYQFPAPQILTPVITSEEAIGDLPDVELDNGAEYPSPPLSKYQSEMRKNSRGIYNHILTNHTEKTKRIISLVPDGGNYKDLPEELRNTRKVNIAWTRLRSDKPSFTIDTGHRHHFHYKFNRIPTVRESARIQSFPDEFIFFGSKADQYAQVGNAVPPKLAFYLAKSIKEFL
ncbi:DNA cytosine methyltransferase [Bacteroidota bacterium]